CFYDCHTNSSFCGLEPPPTCGGNPPPPPPSPEGQKCTLYGPNHDTTSCPQGYSCIVAANDQDPKAAVWNGVCQAWVDGVDYCSSDQACVDHNAKGWTCNEDRECQAPVSTPQGDLTINSHYPNDGETVYGGATITFTFSKPVD